MKIRIKFEKSGDMKFIGHLDVMRFFQKLLRRADIPVAYSQGLSPHQIMSFALPLGIGLESEGEYLDIEITKSISSDTAVDRMNMHSVEGIKILSFKELEKGTENAMASVSTARYRVKFRDDYKFCEDMPSRFRDFYAQNEINILKKTKKSERLVDIKPLIYEYEANADSIELCLSCGSVDNIKPELVIEAFCSYLGVTYDEYMLLITRIDLYTGTYPEILSLDDVGKSIDE